MVGLGLFGLIVHPQPLRKILAFNLIGSGVFLVFGIVARRGAGAGFPADPVPQAMVITGIVVAFSATALAITVLLRVFDDALRALNEKNYQIVGDPETHTRIQQGLAHVIALEADHTKRSMCSRAQRLAESFETALRLGNGIARIAYAHGKRDEITFSSKHACPVCGYSVPPLAPDVDRAFRPLAQNNIPTISIRWAAPLPIRMSLYFLRPTP